MTLPPTGSSRGTGSMALAAALFVLLGGLAVGATRRRSA
ncbi:MAG: LPXTG cell wall anchor domain-containing protein [Ilumatobacter sp.]|nr:LPXTG cell wall anchor domain-containing protein [Ilumatobacter sp.]